jgi:hypothetical protein
MVYGADVMHGAIILVPLLLAWFLWVVAAPGSFYFLVWSLFFILLFLFVALFFPLFGVLGSVQWFCHVSVLFLFILDWLFVT